MTNPPLSGLRYYGGKSALSNAGTGKWIASLLPQRIDVLYCEPFAGMLGVLLQRSASSIEMVNDKNERVVNWWRCVRDKPEEFGRLIAHTPYSRAEFDWACEHLDEGDGLTRGLAFHIVLQQSAMHADSSPYWSVNLNPGQGSLGMWDESNVVRLAERMREVQLETRDASEILIRTAGEANSVIYCDPPYADYSITSHYLFGKNVNSDEFSDLLQSQAGEVAISGYGDMWDHLGWQKHYHSAATRQIGHTEAVKRTEVLWTNFQPAQQSFNFGMGTEVQ